MGQRPNPEGATESGKDHLGAAAGDIKEATSAKVEDIRQAAGRKADELREAAQAKPQELKGAAEGGTELHLLVLALLLVSTITFFAGFISLLIVFCFT